jgi:hypothetical protein
MVANGVPVPWREPQIVPFTRLDIAAQVASESGIFAVLEGDRCLMVGSAWNLKARLLEMANVVREGQELTVVIERCSEQESETRRLQLTLELIPEDASATEAGKPLPGISFRETRPSAQ